jgi:hypothetical protein
MPYNYIIYHTLISIFGSEATFPKQIQPDTCSITFTFISNAAFKILIKSKNKQQIGASNN